MDSKFMKNSLLLMVWFPPIILTILLGLHSLFCANIMFWILVFCAFLLEIAIDFIFYNLFPRAPENLIIIFQNSRIMRLMWAILLISSIIPFLKWW